MIKYIKIFVLIVVFSMCLRFNSYVLADMKITRVELQNNSFNVILNNSIEVLGIRMQNGEIIFPYYVNKGNIYRQIVITNRDFKEYFKKTICEKSFPENAAETAFKINKFKLVKNNKNIKAFASVIFDGVLEVECRIMTGKKGLWVAWPANKENGEWKQYFKFTDLLLKRAVEDKLFKDYNKRNE